MTAALAMVLTAVGTYLFRIWGIVVLGRERELHPRVRRVLSLVAPAALSAIIANAVFLSSDGWREFGAWHVASLVTIAVAVWKRSAGWPMLAGAVVFAAMHLLGW